MKHTTTVRKFCVGIIVITFLVSIQEISNAKSISSVKAQYSKLSLFKKIKNAVVPDFLQSNNVNNPPPTLLREESTNYTYPRLSLGSAWIQDWKNKSGYGLDFLYQFTNFHTATLPHELISVKEAAIADGHADWAENATFIYNYDMASVDTRTFRQPYDWEMGHIGNTPIKAAAFATYFNSILGVDWLMRDIHGEPISTWNNGEVALNLTPSCPQGVWDGFLINEDGEYILDENGEKIDMGIGSTVGITVTEWITGPFIQEVLLDPIFTAAYDGFRSEDGPSGWLYTWNGQIPDPLRNGIGMDYWELTDYAKETWEYFTVNFYGPLNDYMITQQNGHNMETYVEGLPQEMNRAPYLEENIASCKLEEYGGWGGYPNWELDKWIKVYSAIEDQYHPISGQKDDPVYDSYEGWDQTIVQSGPRFTWTQEKKDQWDRSTLSAALMGDGYWDGVHYKEDYYFHGFLRGGQSQYAPHFIDEFYIKLGRALTNYQIYQDLNNSPLYYRQFFNDETQQMYTVVHNPFDVASHNVPPRDGVWFYGDWPHGEFTRVGEENLPPYFLSSSTRESVQENQLIQFTISASDPNPEDSITLSAVGTPFEMGAAFDDHHDGNGIFSWVPDLNSAGSYTVTFTATDNQGEHVDLEITIEVTNMNQPPTLEAVDDQVMSENDTLNLTVYYHDPDIGDGDHIQLQVSLVNATITDQNNGSAIIQWTPPINNQMNANVFKTVKIKITDHDEEFDEVSFRLIVEYRDEEPPTISDILTAVNSRTADISFNTSESSRAQIEYGLTQNYNSSTGFTSQPNIWHRIRLKNLRPSSKYFYKITVKDYRNNQSSFEGSFKTNEAQFFEQSLQNK